MRRLQYRLPCLWLSMENNAHAALVAPRIHCKPRRSFVTLLGFLVTAWQQKNSWRDSQRFPERCFVVESRSCIDAEKAMHPITLALFLALPDTATGMCVVGLAIFLTGIWAAKNDIATSRGLNKVV